MESMSSPFTLAIDWLAFTLPMATVKETMKAIGGDWTRAQSGFRGYPSSWIMSGDGRGIGKMGMGARRKPSEVHVDLSGGIVASWTHEKVRSVIEWVLKNSGHLTRIDCALDDLGSCVSLPTIREAIRAGKCVTRADKMRSISSGSIHAGTVTGETIYIGSPQSQTIFRIYDKRLQLQTQGREDWQDYGIRWEMELKKERAQALGKVLVAVDPTQWMEFVVGVLRSHMDFRDIDRDAPEEYRCRAPLLDWWALLTDGFQKARLVVAKEPETLERVKRWVTNSLAPILAVVCVAEPDGQAWLNEQMNAGVDRWTDRHRRLVEKRVRTKKKARDGAHESHTGITETLPPTSDQGQGSI